AVAEEAAEEAGGATVAVEDALDLLGSRLGDPQAGAVADQEAAAQAAAQPEADAVARHRADPDQRDQRHDVDLPLPGDDPPDDHGGLPGGDQPHEGAGLQEGQGADQGVRVGAQRLPDVAQQLGQAGEAPDP